MNEAYLAALYRLHDKKLDEYEHARDMHERLEAARPDTFFAFDASELKRRREVAEVKMRLLDEERRALARACELMEEASRH